MHDHDPYIVQAQSNQIKIKPEHHRPRHTVYEARGRNFGSKNRNQNKEAEAWI
jgi:hypothetical protein